MDTVEFIFSYTIPPPNTSQKEMIVADTICHQAPSWGGGCHFGRQAIGWARGPQDGAAGVSVMEWASERAGGRR